MNAARVHAVIAGGVGDPRRLASWAADPQTLRALGVDPVELDLSALRGFAGLALKVRHNGLRGPLALTFRLLQLAGIEIELFADYALAIARTATSLARTDLGKARDLVEFIRNWRRPDIAAHALLWSAIRHELALLELTQLEDDTLEGQGAPAHDPTPASRLRVRGAVRLHEMAHDPEEIARMLGTSAPDLGAIATSARALCYWRASHVQAVRIVELDEFGFATIKAAEAGWSVSDLSVSMGMNQRVPAVVRDLLRQLQQAGLLFFSREPRRRR
jgi:hypothetical protein